MQTSLTNIAQLKQALPHGSLKIIAERCNKTIFTVSRVINGKSKNTDVLQAIEEYLKELKEMHTSIGETTRLLTTENLG